MREYSHPADHVEISSDGEISFPKRSLLGITVVVGTSSKAEFKVKGDAVTALEAACKKLRANGGGTLKIEPGTYTLSRNWDLECNSTTVAGAGMGRTILKLQNKAKKFAKAGFIRFRFLRNMEFTGFTIDGNKAQQLKSSKSAMDSSSVTYGRYCFYADGFNTLKFRNVRTQNCQGYGFDPHGIKFKPLIFSENIDIQNCESINNGWDGFTIDQIVKGTIANNVAKGNGRHGFNVVTGTKNLVIRSNRAENNGFGKGEKAGNGCGYCINDSDMLNTRDVDVLNNVAVNSNKAGICVLGAVNVRITGNTFTKANYCLHVVQARTKNVVFSSNKCSTSKGVFIGNGASSGQVKLSGNTGI